jgi:hypothetical protein
MHGVTGAGTEDDGPVLLLPSTGPDPLSFGVALTALRGYARGRRPLRFRSPDSPRGRWVQVPAFGWSRFDARPAGPPGDEDVLIGELLHGRLDRAGWATVRDALDEVRPVTAAAVQRAGGRAFWELPDEELSCSVSRAQSAQPCAGSGERVGTTSGTSSRRCTAGIPRSSLT